MPTPQEELDLALQGKAQKELSDALNKSALTKATPKPWEQMSPDEQNLVKKNFMGFIQKSGDEERAWKDKNPGVNYPAPKQKEPWEQLDPSTRRVLARENKESFATAYGISPSDLDTAGLEVEYQKYLKAPQTAEDTASGSGYRGTVGGLGKPVIGGVQKAANMLSTAVPGLDSLKKYANLSTLTSRWEGDKLQKSIEKHPVAGAFGEMVGQMPYIAAMGNPGSALGAAVRGGALGFLQPVESNDLKMGTVANTLYGAAGGALGDLAITGASKGVGAIRGAATGWLPEAELTAQQKIMGSLGLPKENISAANLRPGRASKIAAMQDAANMSTINESNNVLAGRAGENLVANANGQFRGAPPSGVTELTKAAAAGDLQAQRLLNNRPNITGAVSNATRGEATQWDVEVQQWLANQEYQPFKTAAEKLAPTRSENTGGLLAELDKILADIEAAPNAERLGPVKSHLETVRADVAGKLGTPGVAATQPTMVWAPEHQAVIDQLMTPDKWGNSRFTLADAEAILQKNGATKIPQGGAPGTPGVAGTPGQNTLPQLIHQKKLLESEIDDILGGSNDALTGSARSHWFTMAKNAFLPTIKQGEAAAPGYAQARSLMDQKYRELGVPFKDKAVVDLVGEKGAKVYGSEAMDQILGMPQDKTKALMDILSPKGRTAQKSAVIDGIFKDSLDNTMPKGYQFDREAVLKNIQKVRGQLEGNPDPIIDGVLSGMEEALQMMPTLGVKSKTANVVFHGGMYNKGIGILASNAKGLLTSDSGKAMLLTLNLTRDPAVKSKILKEIALALQRGVAETGATINENQGNPINQKRP